MAVWEYIQLFCVEDLTILFRNSDRSLGQERPTLNIFDSLPWVPLLPNLKLYFSVIAPWIQINVSARVIGRDSCVRQWICYSPYEASSSTTRKTCNMKKIRRMEKLIWWGRLSYSYIVRVCIFARDTCTWWLRYSAWQRKRTRDRDTSWRMGDRKRIASHAGRTMIDKNKKKGKTGTYERQRKNGMKVLRKNLMVHWMKRMAIWKRTDKL